MRKEVVIGLAIGVVLLIGLFHNQLTGNVIVLDSDSCGLTLSSNNEYVLTQDLSSIEGCFSIDNAKNITLDCDGHSITYAKNFAGFGINVSNSQDITIRDCEFVSEGQNATDFPYVLASDVNPEPNVSLKNGWNLVAFPTQQTISLSNLTSACSVSLPVRTLDSSGRVQYIDVNEINSGKAYWLFATEQCEFDLTPYGLAERIEVSLNEGWNFVPGMGRDYFSLLGEVLDSVWYLEGSDLRVTNKTFDLDTGLGYMIDIDVSSVEPIQDNNFGVSFFNVSNSRVENNVFDSDFSGFNNYGLILEKSDSNEFFSNSVSFRGRADNFGVYLKDSFDNTFDSNSFFVEGNSNNKVLYLEGSSENVFNSCSFEGGKGVSFVVEVDSSNIFIDNKLSSQSGFDLSFLGEQSFDNLTMDVGEVSINGKDVKLRALSDSEISGFDEPRGLVSLDKNFEILDFSQSSWAILNVSYSDVNVTEYGSERKFTFWHSRDAEDWDSSDFFESPFGIDVFNDYIYSNITSFGYIGLFNNSERSVSISNQVESSGRSFRILESQLDRGYSQSLEEDDEVVFRVRGSDHTITLDSVETNSVTITIRSDPVTITLDVGEEERVDVDDDGNVDVSIELQSIVSGNVDLFIQSLVADGSESESSSNDVLDGSLPESGSDSLSIDRSGESESNLLFILTILFVVFILIIAAYIFIIVSKGRKYALGDFGPLFKRAREAIRDKEIERAKRIYDRIYRKYEVLTLKEKEKMRAEVSALYNKLYGNK